MRALILACSILFVSTFVASRAQCQESTSDNSAVEGTVVSSTRNTLVVRTDDNQYQLFTHDRGAVRSGSLVPGARVRVTAGPADENGTRVASNIAVVTAPSADKGAQAAPVPEKIRDIESDIKRESRRWRVGVRAGAAFDPELFGFGVQSQMGPILHPRVFFRPNAEFAFGEVTDLIALNFEGVYRFSATHRSGNWTPYVGAGPAMIFIHQSLKGGRDINFSNFDYETGLNVLAGMQSRKGTFVELKTSLYSGPAPKLRLIIGYNF
jgi:RNase P/RNase MRP subunit p29